MVEQNTLIKNTNMMKSELVKGLLQQKIEALKAVLQKYNVPSRFYAIMEPGQEDSFCLDFRDDRFVTFTIERGREHHHESFDDFDKAALDMISMFAADQEDYEILKKDYEYHSQKATWSLSHICEIINKFANNAAIF